MTPAGHTVLSPDLMKAGERSSQRLIQRSRQEAWNQGKPVGWGTNRAGCLLPSSLHSAPQMGAIGKLSDDMRRHFRMKLRNLFTKFIRKFGSVP